MQRQAHSARPRWRVVVVSGPPSLNIVSALVMDMIGYSGDYYGVLIEGTNDVRVSLRESVRCARSLIDVTAATGGPGGVCMGGGDETH